MTESATRTQGAASPLPADQLAQLDRFAAMLATLNGEQFAALARAWGAVSDTREYAVIADATADAAAAAGRYDPATQIVRTADGVNRSIATIAGAAGVAGAAAFDYTLAVCAADLVDHDAYTAMTGWLVLNPTAPAAPVAEAPARATTTRQDRPGRVKIVNPAPVAPAAPAPRPGLGERIPTPSAAMRAAADVYHDTEGTAAMLAWLRIMRVFLGLFAIIGLFWAAASVTLGHAGVAALAEFLLVAMLLGDCIAIRAMRVGLANVFRPLSRQTRDRVTRYSDLVRDRT